MKKVSRTEENKKYAPVAEDLVKIHKCYKYILLAKNEDFEYTRRYLNSTKFIKMCFLCILPLFPRSNTPIFVLFFVLLQKSRRKLQDSILRQFSFICAASVRPSSFFSLREIYSFYRKNVVILL
jgi:hypothetical protein